MMELLNTWPDLQNCLSLLGEIPVIMGKVRLTNMEFWPQNMRKYLLICAQYYSEVLHPKELHYDYEIREMSGGEMRPAEMAHAHPAELPVPASELPGEGPYDRTRTAR
jgi:hypothetical protein